MTLAESDYGRYPVGASEKVTGAGRYTADIDVPGALHAGFLGSPHAHARIVSIDTSAALAVPGVHAVLTGRDVPPGARFGRRLMDWPVLARDRVRFVGDRVVAVAADTREAADEALRLIHAEYDELPAVLDSHAALAPNAPILHPEEDAAAYRYTGGTRPSREHPNLQGQLLVRKGESDLESVFASAHRVFEHTFTAPRQHQGYIEPHACVVWIDGDTVHVVTTNKSPFFLRQQLAVCTGVPEERIEVETALIGGDFGGKGTSFDEFACYFLAVATGRPVRAVMTYADELRAANPRHPAVIRLRTGVDQHGRFVAHEADVLFDGGAYAGGKTSPDLVLGGGSQTLAPYRVPNVLIEVRTVYTNTVPGGHARAPGAVQGAFAGESHVDMIASGMGIDPLELRLRNALRPGDTGPTGRSLREPRAVEVLEALRRESDWGAEPMPAGRGRGVALSVRHVGGGKTSLRARLVAGGTIEVLTAVPDQGSGAHTVIRLVAAEVLSVDPRRVAVVQGSTHVAPVDPGAGASRGTHIEGQAALAAATLLKQRLEDLAAETMGWPAGRVRIENDRFVVEDSADEGAPFAEIAERIALGAPVEVTGAYDGMRHSRDEPEDFDFVGYMAEVEVDRATGAVQLLNVVLAVDVGTVIDPVAHQGQLEGGFVGGLGAALMEELSIGADGGVTTLNLGDYKLPTVVDMPRLRTVLVPTLVGPGPFGAKMAGELTNTTVAPAIANAVADAVGARVNTLPLTPERVLAALQPTS